MSDDASAIIRCLNNTILNKENSFSYHHAIDVLALHQSLNDSVRGGEKRLRSNNPLLYPLRQNADYKLSFCVLFVNTVNGTKRCQSHKDD